MLLLNFIFLLNIIRVLVVKLRQSHTSDIEQVRKAVRAAIVLIPLLGITNILNMTEAPLHRTALEFALWSYITHFLASFQGLFIATIYCFLNNEVCITYCASCIWIESSLDDKMQFEKLTISAISAIGACGACQKHWRIHVVAWTFRLAAEATPIDVFSCVRYGTRHRAAPDITA